MSQAESLLARARSEFHASLIASGTLSVSESGIASISDKGNRLSRDVGLAIAKSLRVETEAERAAGQTLGSDFEAATAAFLSNTFPAFTTLRPGCWVVRRVEGARSEASIDKHEPYQHLEDLAEAIRRDPTLRAVLGNGYEISPDVVIARLPESDDVINSEQWLVDDSVGRLAAIRSHNQLRPILHAVVSCKWTLRSDRAQNARSEALNLIRNRKGRLPHIVVISAEPTPSRLASLALGTGDIDCVYHVALPELVEAIGAYGNASHVEMLETMIEGRRLKDISDLPLDLTV